MVGSVFRDTWVCFVYPWASDSLNKTQSLQYFFHLQNLFLFIQPQQREINHAYEFLSLSPTLNNLS